jgi:LAS superfamily LD-carboxypeptidase LdcB
MNELELTGRARTHVVDLADPRCTLHYEVVAALLAMKDAAARAGIDLSVVSSFRDFDTQLVIWNRKWAGERPLYDRRGRLLDRAGISDSDMVDTILTWSAVPGGSRHHWGSDIDVIDRAALPPDYKVELVPAEFASSGVFAALTAWLDRNMHRFGFFRPYSTDRGAVMPEPWHLSYHPVASAAVESLSLSMLRQVLEASSIAGKAHVLARLPEIYTRYLLATDHP